MASTEALLTTEDNNVVIYYQLGPWLIGSFFDVLFQGVLFTQFSHYVEWHWQDKLSIRLQVLVLAILTTLKAILSFVAVWIMLVTNFSDIPGVIAVSYEAWWYKGNTLMVATIGAFVQVFFCNRLFAVSKRNWFALAPIITVLLFSYVSAIITTHHISINKASNASSPGAGVLISKWNASHLGSVFAGDMLITLFTAYFLLKTKKKALPQTIDIITGLINLTIQSAAPASLCAMVNLLIVITQIQSSSNRLMSTAANLMLPKLYAFSMMWTLNSRHTIRNAGSSGRQISHLSSGRRRDNVELKPYNTTNIQVHTQVETVREIDIRFGDQIHEFEERNIKTESDDFKLKRSA